MHKIIKDSTSKERKTADEIEKQIIKNGNSLLKLNPHISIYKILDVIDEFNHLKS